MPDKHEVGGSSPLSPTNFLKLGMSDEEKRTNGTAGISDKAKRDSSPLSPTSRQDLWDSISLSSVSI